VKLADSVKKVIRRLIMRGKKLAEIEISIPSNSNKVSRTVIEMEKIDKIIAERKRGILPGKFFKIDLASWRN
jgi:hypothetical protein